ncbi:hypothetical protein OUZ56_027931 [Daphnia magna]|uniref:Uncharacterized protein n=1 Tax=Daphnia magna TaxID=35525 RepID=A0ABR0B2G2_9CRUS|nr:hypothetical protein OUZ56_027931 [Daphnia magna]
MEGDMYAKGTIRVHLLCRSGDGYSLMLHRPALMALIPLCFLCRSASSPQTRKSFLKAFKRSFGYESTKDGTQSSLVKAKFRLLKIIR